MTQLLGASRTDAGPGPTVGPTTPAPTVSSPSAPTLTPQERAIVDRCSHASTPPPPSPTLSEQDPDTTTGRGTVVKSSSTRSPGHVPPALDARRPRAGRAGRDGHVRQPRPHALGQLPARRRWLADRQRGGPDGPRARPARSRRTGTDRTDSATTRWHRRGRRSARRAKASSAHASSSPAPFPGTPTWRRRVSTRRTGRCSPGLRRLHLRVPAREKRVDPHRAANDNQPLPSMPVTLLDDQGQRIIRYDYFPSYIIPGSCPSTGGC